MKSKLLIAAVSAVLLIGGTYYFGIKPKEVPLSFIADKALAAKFDGLRKNGNSSCSPEFTQAIRNGTSGLDRIQGSCCSPMDMHRYSEQIEGLKKYKDIPEIPTDPYDIDTALAKELARYYDATLSPDQQKIYDYAMQNSMGKGPCCCKCWGWDVYGGLAKKLIIERGFTGEQITEIWDLSDMCGGPGNHINHT